MDDREREILATWRGEAASFFVVNQAARTAAERSLALLFTAIAITVAAGVNEDTPDVVLPLPSLTMLLFAYMCNQYSDLTVLGMARAELEERVNSLLGEHALIYESAVAPIRKARPLSTSVRLLQTVGGLLVLAVTIVGTAVAFDGQPEWVTIGYCAATATSLLAAVVAYRSMLATPTVAVRAIRAAIASPAPPGPRD